MHWNGWLKTQWTNEAKYPWPKSQVINYNSERGGVSVITEKGETTTSYLLIQDARVSDSGKYSCSPSNADVAGVRVHVLANGKCFFRFTKLFLRISFSSYFLLCWFTKGKHGGESENQKRKMHKRSTFYTYYYIACYCIQPFQKRFFLFPISCSACNTFPVIYILVTI